MKPEITVLGALSVIIASAPPVSIFLKPDYAFLISGFAVLTYLGVSRFLSRKVLESSGTRRSKAFQDLVGTISVFLVLGAIGLTSVVPVWLGLLVVSLVGVTLIFLLQMNRRYRNTFRLGIGKNYWLLLTAVLFLGSHFNSYFLFYGVFVLSITLAYDLFSLIREM